MKKCKKCAHDMEVYPGCFMGYFRCTNFSCQATEPILHNKIPFTTEDARKVLEDVEFLNFKFLITPMSHGNQHILKILYVAPDNTNRKNNIEIAFETVINITYLTPSDFVSFCYSCVQKCLIHEASEVFKYKNSDVFNEHNKWDKVKTRNMIENLINRK